MNGLTMTHTLIHPDFGNGLTNHEPMVVSALKELDATKAHIAHYQALMAEKTKPVTEPLINIRHDDELLLWLGKGQNYAGLHHYFAKQQAELGSRHLVNRYVPTLADGVTGGALHPLIRLGHAVHDDRNDEIVAALAYWAWAYQALPYPQADDERNVDVSEVLPSLLDDVHWPTSRIDRPTITDEFAVLVVMPAYQQLRFNANSASLSFEKLRSLSATALWMHDDFTLLHGVTGLLAAERVTKWLDDKSLLLRPMWKAIVIAWLSKGLRWRSLPLIDGEPTLSLSQIKTLAAHGMRDHTVKLVAACLENYRKTQDKLYWWIAQREVMNDAQLKLML